MRRAAIVQARMGSSRFPGKVLEGVLGEPMLVRVVERASRAERLDGVIVATTDRARDEPIVALCAERGWPCHRGSEEDVLDRYYRTAQAYGVELVVRITSDCPLIFPAHIDEAVARLTERPQVDYVSNRVPPRLPSGTDVEVFPFRVLERVWSEAQAPASREHVTLHIYEGSTAFRVASIHPERDLSSLHLSVDTPEDLALIRRIYGHFGHDRFTWDELLPALEAHPEWLAMNGSSPPDAGSGSA